MEEMVFPSDFQPKLIVRLPEDVKAFIVEQAKRNRSSQNSEIIRAIRERMDRVSQPAAESNQHNPMAATYA
jgi:hypothetical protein